MRRISGSVGKMAGKIDPNPLTSAASGRTLPANFGVDMSTIATATLEIRAPRAQVLALANTSRQASRWLWATAQVGRVSSERDLPDGGFQRVNESGDKLKDSVVLAEGERVTLESEWVPKDKLVPGRKLRLELGVAPGPGTTRASLSVAFADKRAPTEVAEQRRWRRHVEQCLSRLAALAAPEISDHTSDG